MAAFFILLGIAVLVLAAVGYFMLMFNNLVSLRARVNNAWSQIDVQLTKRYDLVPNLVNTVKGYAKHEKQVFENVTKARSEAMQAQSVGEKAQADDMLSNALKSLFAVAENYPNLKASQNFKLLQEQLDGIESKIAYARQFYNDSVLGYNTKIQQIPEALMAKPMGFEMRDYFQAEKKARKAVEVKF